MSRAVFVSLAGVVAIFFGLTMFFVPSQMLSNISGGGDAAAAGVLQWMAVALFSIGWIDVLASRDAGSPALRAVMIGNVLLHGLGWATDIYQHLQGFVTAQGLMMGTVVHVLLGGGFLFYLRRLRGVRA